jgi:regulatory protein
VEGRYAFSISTRLAEEKLHVGDAVSAAAVDKLLNDDQRLRCYDAAIRFLGVRPRSEREIRDRLAKHEFAPQVVDGVMEKLRRLDLVDDAAFAEYWIDQRQSHRPRGGRLLKQELRLKGVDVEVAAAALPAE